MHKHVPVIAAAALAVSGLAFGQAQQESQQQQQQSAQIAGAQAGGAQELQRQIPNQAATVREDASAKNDVQKVIAKVTEAAITEGRFDQIKQSLAKSDQDRMQQGGQAMGQQTPGQPGAQPAGQPMAGQQQSQELDRAIKDLRQAYKDKYNKDLQISESRILPERVTVVSGEITNPQMLTQWPLRATQSSMGGRAQIGMGQDDQAQPAGAGIGQTQQQGQQLGQPGQSQRGGLKQGDKIAAVRIPGETQPELTVSLVQSGSDWQLDVPDTLDSNKLRQNLVKHLQHITQNKDKMPQDADKASQQISHHVLMALYDVDVQQGGAQQRQPGGM